MKTSAPHERPASWYRDSIAVELEPCAPLTEDRHADVCVIGGGVTGCSAALHLAERGYSVALLEAEDIGHGASGRSGGQILPGLGTDIATVEQALGLQCARRIWEMSREAVRLTAELVERHAIPCELAWGYLHAAVKPRHVRELEQFREELSRKYGYEALEWLEGEALHEHVVTDVYPAASTIARGATFTRSTIRWAWLVPPSEPVLGCIRTVPSRKFAVANRLSCAPSWAASRPMSWCWEPMPTRLAWCRSCRDASCGRPTTWSPPRH